jgi:hypothetical protein
MDEFPMNLLIKKILEIGSREDKLIGLIDCLKTWMTLVPPCILKMVKVEQLKLS